MAMQPLPQQMETTRHFPMYPPPISPMIMTNTVIVFDFDDTLFPYKKWKEINSMSNATKINNSTPNYSAQSFMSKMSDTELTEFIELSWATLNLLKSYINQYSHKNIYIVSASSKGWIKKALKSVYDIGAFNQIYHLILENYRILTFNPSSDVMKSFGIKKAYKTYGDHPCSKWKYNTFKFILNQRRMNNFGVINTFVFIGDSPFEYEAANKLRNEVCKKDKNKNMFIDRIKLKYKPKINELINEQKYLQLNCGAFEYYSCVNMSGFDVDYVESEKEFVNTKATEIEQSILTDMNFNGQTRIL